MRNLTSHVTQQTMASLSIMLMLVGMGFSPLPASASSFSSVSPSPSLSGTPPFPSLTSTTQAVLLNLAPTDLQEFLDGLRESYFGAPIQGRFSGRIEHSSWWGVLGIEGISYSFRLKKLAAEPRAVQQEILESSASRENTGHLNANAAISDLQVRIDKITFNASGSSYCSDMPIETGAGQDIPVETRIIPRAASRQVSIDLAGTNVLLNSSNFTIGTPATCEALWGFNWLIRSSLPWIAGAMRARIAEGIETAMGTAVRDFGESLNAILQANITLPFAVKPAKAFYATLSLWPQSFALDNQFVQFKMGADIRFDPDLMPKPEAQNLSSLPFADLAQTSLMALQRLPSYVGIARPLLSAILGEANKKGLFSIPINAATAPNAADLLTQENLARVFPDAATRFASSANVHIQTQGAENIRVTLKPGNALMSSLIEVQLLDLKIDTYIGEQAYYQLTTDMTLQFNFDYSTSTRQLSLSLQDFNTKIKAGQFAPDLSPAPILTQRDDAQLVFLVRAIQRRLMLDSDRLMTISIPDLPIGSRKLKMLGAGIRDDYVTLDAAVL